MGRQARVLMRETRILGQLSQFTDLRAERVVSQRAQRGVVPHPGAVVSESTWRFDHQGYAPVERDCADSVARAVLDRRRGKGGRDGQ